MVTTPTILSLSPQCLSINFILHHLQLSIPSIPRNDSCSSFLVFYSILLLSLPCGPPMLSPAVTLLVWSAQTIGRLVGSDLLHPWIVWLINFSLAPGPFYSCPLCSYSLCCFPFSTLFSLGPNLSWAVLLSHWVSLCSFPGRFQFLYFPIGFRTPGSLAPWLSASGSQPLALSLCIFPWLAFVY